MLPEIGFTVVNENPEGLYVALRDTKDLRESGSIKSRIYTVAELYADQGLFDRCIIRVDAIEVNGTRGWGSHAAVRYREPSDEYWTAEDREQLSRLITSMACDIDSGMEPVSQTEKTGRYELDIKNPAQQLSFTISPFYDNEKAKWLDQVRTHDEFLRIDHLPLPSDLREGAGKSLSHLVHTLDPLPDSSWVHIQLNGLDEQRRKCFLALKPETFLERIRTWISFVEMAVKTMSEVKGKPQTGILIMRPF